MDKILAVARREFLATVRTRAFLLTVVLMPGLIVCGIFGGEAAQRMSRTEKRPVRRLAVAVPAAAIFEALGQQVAAHNAERPAQPFELESVPPEAADPNALAARVNRGELYGYLILGDDALDLDGSGGVLARKDSQLETGRRLERMINEAIFAVRFHNAGLDATAVAALRRNVPLRWADVQTGKEVSINPLVQFMTPFAFMFLLFMGTFGIGQNLLTSLIEEKGSRVVEVLLSALSPVQLLAGKILGLVCVGFVLLAVWGGVGFASAHKYNMGELVNAYRLFCAVLYFVPGFLLIASILAAIGSACNELKDAQSMVFPLSLITIVPMIFWFYIAEHPDSILSVALSYIPPVTPFVMILRICSDPHTPIWQIVTTLLLLWASVIAVIWAAGKVFRIGVLMYGKPPTLAELVRWVRQA